MDRDALSDLELAAQKFRREQNSKNRQSQEFEEQQDHEDYYADDLEDDEFEEDTEHEDELHASSEPSSDNDDFLYTSKDVKITATHIEIDNLTYAISYIASTKRIERKPPIHECMISMAFTVISLITLITYLLLGKLKLGLLAVSYFSLIMMAFLTLSIICQQLKSTFSLELYNFQGNVVDRISSLPRSTIAKIEKAIKTAIASRET